MPRSVWRDREAAARRRLGLPRGHPPASGGIGGRGTTEPPGHGSGRGEVPRTCIRPQPADESLALGALSDGADTGSTAPRAAVTSAARAAHIRLFTIGLRSPHFAPSTLEALAAAGGGQYALAESTSSLAPLFDQLGARLASEYLL